MLAKMGICRYTDRKQLDARMIERLKWNSDGIYVSDRRYHVCNKLIRCRGLYYVEDQGEVAFSCYELKRGDRFRAWDFYQEVNPLDGSKNISETSKSLNMKMISLFNVMRSIIPSFITIHEGSSIRFELDGVGKCFAEIEIYGMLEKGESLGSECDFYEYDNAGDAVMRTV